MSLPAKKLKALAVETQRPLREVFADIPGSFEAYHKEVWKALKQQRPGPLAQNSGSFYIDALLCEDPLQVIVEMPKYDGNAYTHECYRFDLEFSDTDGITFTNPEQVVYDVQVKAKNEYQALQESLATAKGAQTRFDEVLDTTVTLVEAKTGATQARTASVAIAQRADTVNNNKRYYAGAVLQEAVTAAQTRIADKGYLLMDSQHRPVPEGASTPLRETVALIKSVEYDAANGVVTLPDIQFVETQAGKDILALLEGGATLQVSQNGYGASHQVYDQDLGTQVEHVDFLRFDGWDFVPSGKAGVSDATLTTEGSPANAASASKSLNEGDASTASDANAAASAPASQTPAASTAQSLTEGEPRPATATSEPPDEAAIAAAVKAALSEETKSLNEQLRQATDTAQAARSESEQTQAALAQQQAALTESAQEQQLAHLKHVGLDIVERVLAEYKRFNTSQLEWIRKKIHIGTYREKVANVYNTDALAEAITADIKFAVEELDEVLSTSQLTGLGYPIDSKARIVNPYLGDVTAERVFAEAYPTAELGMQDYQFSQRLLAEIQSKSPADIWIMPEDHESMPVLAKQLSTYARANYNLLQETTQSGIATRMARIAMATIPVIWRTTSAFQVATLGTQELPIQDIPIEVWDQAPASRDFLGQYNRVSRTETGTINKSTLSYTNFQMIATEQSVLVDFTTKAHMMAANTPLDPVRSSLAYMSMQIVNTLDSLLWALLLYHGLNYSKTEVATAELLTQSGSTKVWNSKNRAWIPFSYVKTYDTNNNPLTALMKSSAPDAGSSAAPSDLGFQGVEVTVGSGTPLTMQYGTHYTIDFQSGAIILTTAGETRRGTASGGTNTGKVLAKYTYSTNAENFSLTAASGTTFVQHLMNLRNTVGQAKTRSALRNYPANRVALDYGLAERITNSAQFTPIGGTEADAVNMMNEVTHFVGLETVRTTSPAIEDWILVFQNGAVHHNNHTPFTVRANHDRKNEDYHIGYQMSASDVPKPDSITPVAVRA